MASAIRRVMRGSAGAIDNEVVGIVLRAGRGGWKR